MKKIFLLLLVGLLVAVPGVYYDCYGSCPSQNLSVGCEINSSLGNLVKLGNITSHYYHEYFINSSQYREDLYCYYLSEVKNVTNKSIQSYNKTPLNLVNYFSIPNPPIIPKPNNKNIRKLVKVKFLNLSKVNFSININWSLANISKPKPVLTGTNTVKHFFKCPDSCKKELNSWDWNRKIWSSNPNVLFPKKKYWIIKCSILYNFDKNHVEELINNPLSHFKKGGKFYKTHSIYKNGSWSYDEVLYCEYDSNMEQGVETSAEKETPYDRLGYFEPIDPSNMTIAIENDTILLPPGYIVENGSIYKTDFLDKELWLEEYNKYSKKDYVYIPILLKYLEENKEIFDLIDEGRVMVKTPFVNVCIVNEDKKIEYIANNCSDVNGELEINEEVLEKLSYKDPNEVLKEEFGKGIKYKSNTLIGSIRVFILELIMRLAP